MVDQVKVFFEGDEGDVPIGINNPMPVSFVSGGSAPDRELVVTTYSVKNAFTGASIGDTITMTQIIDVSGTPSTVSTIWRNQSTGADLASAPLASDLSLVGAGGPTSAQIGSIDESPPASDTASSGLNGRLQRVAQRLTSLIGYFLPITTATLSNVSASATSVTLLAANTGRRRITIVNDSTSALYVKFGATASASSYTYLLAAGDTYESPTMDKYTGIIDGIWVSANGAARITECV